MTRKHFIKIAEELNSVKPLEGVNLVDYAGWIASVYAVACACASFNSNFDRDRFIAACKGE